MNLRPAQLDQLAAAVADRLAERLYDKRMAGRAVYKRGDVWWIRYLVDGRMRYESSGSVDVAVARRLLDERSLPKASPSECSLTVNGLVHLVRADYEQTGKRDAQNLVWRWDKHISKMIGDVGAAELSAAMIGEYVRARRTAGAADATINRELAIVRRGFTLALRDELVDRAPYVPKLRESNVRQGFIEQETYQVLRQALPEHLQALFVVGYHVGARLGELRSLTWPQVDLPAAEIRLSGDQTKTGKPRTLPIFGEMDTVLQMERERRLTHEKYSAVPWVFAFKNRQVGEHLKGWKEACAKVGVPQLHFHDLRRSAIRNMERAGIPRSVAMQISGHRTESVYRRYDIVSQRDLQRAAARMEEYFKAGVTRGDRGKRVEVADELGWVEGFEPSATGITKQQIKDLILTLSRML